MKEPDKKPLACVDEAPDSDQAIDLSNENLHLMNHLVNGRVTNSLPSAIEGLKAGAPWAVVKFVGREIEPATLMTALQYSCSMEQRRTSFDESLAEQLSVPINTSDSFTQL